MEIEEVKNQANKELMKALDCCGMGNIFKVIAGGVLYEDPDESCSIEYEITFSYGNLKHTHALVIGWNTDYGIGIELGDDGETIPITYGSVMASMYFDMAMTGLDDKYIN